MRLTLRKRAARPDAWLLLIWGLDFRPSTSEVRRFPITLALRTLTRTFCEIDQLRRENQLLRVNSASNCRRFAPCFCVKEAGMRASNTRNELKRDVLHLIQMHGSLVRVVSQFFLGGVGVCIRSELGRRFSQNLTTMRGAWIKK